MKFDKDDVMVILDNSVIQPSVKYNHLADPGEVVEKLDGLEFIHVHVNSLQRYYMQLSPKDKELFIGLLASKLSFRTGTTVAITAFNTLIHIGKFDKAFATLLAGYNDYKISYLYVPIFADLADTLKYEWNIFTRDHIDSLYRWVTQVLDGKNKHGKMLANNKSTYLMRGIEPVMGSLYRRLNIIKTLDIKKRIFIGTNEEITNDSKVLKLEFNKYNFPDDLSEAIEKVEIKLIAGKDHFDFKSCMDLLRSFSERLYRHIAIHLDELEGSKVNEKKSEEVAAFFVKRKLISQDQGKLLVSLRHFLSNDGVHRLKSRLEDARLSRNMMIELSLYLMYRLNDLSATQINE